VTSTSPVQPVVRTLSQEQLQAYADASHDHNPIHVDPEFARSTPFGGTIAHGMLVLALIGEMMQASFGGRWTSSGRLKVRFKAPARPGDTITASADATGENTYAVTCVNQRGDMLIEGRASIGAAA
jgi:3-hydroxybutyryl-CoA dehydratase